MPTHRGKEQIDCYMLIYNKSNSGYESYQLPCYPESLSDATSANWSNQTIVGRSAPIYAFTGTGAREISFSFELHREMEMGGTSSYRISESELKYGTTYIDKVLAAMRKTVYPQYLAKGLLPPIVRFRFGQFVAKGFVSNVTYNWKKPIRDGRYMCCDVSINMTAFASDVVGQSDLSTDPLNPFNQSLRY